MRLVKTYATLRWDDMQRLRLEHVALRDAGLTGRLLRTKTSGAGRRVRELPLFVPRGAWLASESWLATGYKIWAEIKPKDRDFFLPRPVPSLGGFTARAASSADAAWLGEEVLARAPMPERIPGDEMKFRHGSGLLFTFGLSKGWTNHSERSTLPSALAAIGVEKDRRNLLGRWGPDGSDEYVRTYRSAVRELVALFVGSVRAGRSYEDFDEEEAFEDAANWASVRAESAAGLRQRAAELKLLSKELLVVDAGPVPKGLAPGTLRRVRDAVADDTGGEDEPAKFILAFARGRKGARLHAAMGCFSARTLGFADYELCDELPDPSRYSSRCLHCFAEGLSSGPADSSEDETDASSRNYSS